MKSGTVIVLEFLREKLLTGYSIGRMWIVALVVAAAAAVLLVLSHKSDRLNENGLFGFVAFIAVNVAILFTILALVFTMIWFVWLA